MHEQRKRLSPAGTSLLAASFPGLVSLWSLHFQDQGTPCCAVKPNGHHHTEDLAGRPAL